MIMGDICNTLDILLARDGADYNLLSEEENAANDISNYCYQADDRKALRHFEGATMPAKWSTITIVDDISRVDQTKDLCNRGEKTVLVKKSTATSEDISPEMLDNYTKVELMDPSVETYCKLYTEDIAHGHGVGLTAQYLPTTMNHHVLLNPMFGLMGKVTGSVLLTDVHYYRGRISKLLINVL